MKIQLQFERDDLEEMLTEYFKTRGFEIKNMETLHDAFAVAWPQGLSVAAQTIEAPTKPAVVALPANITNHADEAPLPPPRRNEGNPRMTASDLFDPDSNNHAPSRDELLAENAREIQNILAESNILESQKKVR